MLAWSEAPYKTQAGMGVQRQYIHKLLATCALPCPAEGGHSLLVPCVVWLTELGGGQQLQYEYAVLCGIIVASSYVAAAVLGDSCR